MTLRDDRRPIRTTRLRPPGHRFIVIFAAATFATAPWSGAKFGPMALADLFTFLTLLTGLPLILRGRSTLTVPIWLWLPTATSFVVLFYNEVFSSAALSSTPGVTSPSIMFGRIALSTLGLGLVCILVAKVRPDFLIRAVAWFALGSSISAGVALLQSVGIRPVLPGVEQVVSEFTGRWTGLASHPNALAQASVLAIPAIFLLLSRHRGILRLTWLICLVGLVLSVFASGSRAGLIVGAIVSAVSVVVFFGRGRRLGSILAALLAMGFLSITFGSQVISQTRLGAGDEYGAALSNVGRVEAISEGWSLFTDHPIAGAGLGSWYGELGVLVVLVSGGLILGLAYTAFLTGVAVRIFAGPTSVDAAYFFISLVAVLGFATLNNGFFERYTFLLPLIGMAFSTTARR